MNQHPINRRLIHEAAFLASREIVSACSEVLPTESERAEALRIFMNIITAAIESYAIQAERMDRRMNPCPSKN